jgi:hypothetical protein
MRDPRSVRGKANCCKPCAGKGPFMLRWLPTPNACSRVFQRHLPLDFWCVTPIHQRLLWAMDDVCEGRKALNGSGPPDNQQEVTMRLITRFDAASRSTAELHALLREAFNAFASAPRGSIERSNALASLHNIEAELAVRPPGL